MPYTARAKYYEHVGDGSIRDLFLSDRPYLTKYDILSVSFTIYLWFGNERWGVDVRPRHIVRVGVYQPPAPEQANPDGT